MGDPGINNGVGEPMGVPTHRPLGEINFFWGKDEPAVKSCQALGPEVRNSKGRGDPEDIMEAQK